MPKSNKCRTIVVNCCRKEKRKCDPCKKNPIFKNVVRPSAEAFVSGNIVALINLYAPNAVLTFEDSSGILPYGGVWSGLVGPRSIPAFYETLAANTANISAVVEAYYGHCEDQGAANPNAFQFVTQFSITSSNRCPATGQTDTPVTVTTSAYIKATNNKIVNELLVADATRAAIFFNNICTQ